MNKRRRKMLLVLPLLVIPFLTLAFWAMGGGTQAVGNTKIAGLNLKLPDPQLKEDMIDKLGFYAKVDKDSMKLKEWMQNDPYYDMAVTSEDKETSPDEKLLQRIDALQREIRHPYEVKPLSQRAPNNEKVEKLLEIMNEPAQEDPEMKVLDGTLEKILDIQHPQRVVQRIRDSAVEREALLVSTRATTDSLVSGFYGMSHDVRRRDENAIEVTVHENQQVVDGSVIRMRLMQDIFIDGVRVPAGNFVSGIVSLNGERLKVDVDCIRLEGSLFPVKLSAYDMDGIAGIYIPGAITRDVAKSSVDNRLQTFEMGGSVLDPSLKAQATMAGVGMAKSLLSKKVKMVKVQLKSGYRLLLK